MYGENRFFRFMTKWKKHLQATEKKILIPNESFAEMLDDVALFLK